MSLYHPALHAEQHVHHAEVASDVPEMSRSAAMRALLHPKRCKHCEQVIPSHRAAKRDYCTLRCRYAWHDLGRTRRPAARKAGA